MHIFRHLSSLVVLASILATGCGGGGSSSPSESVAVETAPANGNYAGTYSCVDTPSAFFVFNASLQSATGTFSSCSGSSQDGSIAITCAGSIASDGTFSASGTDSHGNSLSFTGNATSTQVIGNYSVTPAGVSGDFECKH